MITLFFALTKRGFAKGPSCSRQKDTTGDVTFNNLAYAQSCRYRGSASWALPSSSLSLLLLLSSSRTLPAAISRRETTTILLSGVFTNGFDPLMICLSRRFAICTTTNRLLTFFRQSSIVIRAIDFYKTSNDEIVIFKISNTAFHLLYVDYARIRCKLRFDN
jgi:hypothetical protein